MDAPGQAIVDPQYVEIQALRAELDALHYVTDERSRELDAARAHIAQLETALATADRAYEALARERDQLERELDADRAALEAVAEAARAFAEKYIGTAHEAERAAIRAEQPLHNKERYGGDPPRALTTTEGDRR